jgi:hypothetical protein
MHDRPMKYFQGVVRGTFAASVLRQDILQGHVQAGIAFGAVKEKRIFLDVFLHSCFCRALQRGNDGRLQVVIASRARGGGLVPAQKKMHKDC